MIDGPFADYEKAAPTEFEIIQIPEGEWADDVNSGARAQLKQLHKGSYFWDELISRFTKSILTATAPNPLNASVNMHETAVRMLASETRFICGQLAKEYQAKIRGTPGHARTSKIFRSPLTPHTCIILVIFPKEVGQTSDDVSSKASRLASCAWACCKAKNARSNDIHNDWHGARWQWLSVRRCTHFENREAWS